MDALIGARAHAPSRAVSGALAGNIPGEPSALESSTRSGQPAGARVGTREGACAPQTSDAWRAAHRRLYEHLCATTPDKPQPTLEDLQPLYQAVAHGCLAGLQQEALAQVYCHRLQRGEERYATFRLGAISSDLGAVVCFFETPWHSVSSKIREDWKGWLMQDAAFLLIALGRLNEALMPVQAGCDIARRLKHWGDAAQGVTTLSGLKLKLGDVVGAIDCALRSVIAADHSNQLLNQVSSRAQQACGLHQAGRRGEAETRFLEAEQMQAERMPAYPLLCSLSGFDYCDLLLAAPERAAWGEMLKAKGQRLKGGQPTPDSAFSLQPSALLQSCRAVSQRAAQTLRESESYPGTSLFNIALDDLTLGRAALYAAILEPCRSRRKEAPTSSAESQRLLTSSPTIETARRELDAAVAGLRRAGTTDHIPRALLTRAWLRFLIGACTSPESAQEDLDEAWEIAERGPMKLFLADIHLYRARLFFREKAYPWESPAVDLAAARKLIEQCGYWRRKEELEDAEMAIGV